MSGSRKSTDDHIAASGSEASTQNPFVSFRRAVDAQISSILHNVFVTGAPRRESGDKLDPFDEMQQAWEQFAKERKEEASRFYVLEDGKEVQNQKANRWGFSQIFSREKAQEPQGEGNVQDHVNAQWLGHDGKKRRAALQTDEQHVENDPSSNRLQRQSTSSVVSALAAKLGALKPIKENIRKNETLLHRLQNNGYPDYGLPPETVDDPFTNIPAAVPWLLHNEYSPLNIHYTSFDGRRLGISESGNEEEESSRAQRDFREKRALATTPFKEAFEDLMTLQTQGRMISYSENYASSRNSSGHPMHWITRLIEAGSLGQEWSVWGNGTTRLGLWFFNRQSHSSVNATLHARLAQMHHIPYQAYKMRRTWILPRFEYQISHFQQTDIDLDTAVDQANRAVDYNSTKLHWPQADVTHIYEDEFDMTQASISHFELALEGLKGIVFDNDGLARHLIAAKMDELYDRSINISEYLTSKALGLSEAWWYRSESEDMFDQDRCWKRSFAAVPFLAMAHDEVGLVSGGIEACKSSINSGNMNRISDARLEIYIDLHRIKRLTEMARWTRDSHISPAFEQNSSLHEFDQVLDWANENINVLKSQFIEEGIWEELGQQWQPSDYSDYRWKNITDLRSDCFPHDKSLVTKARSPGILRMFSSIEPNDCQFSPLYSPETPSPYLSEAQNVHYMTNLVNNGGYEPDAASQTLRRECLPAHPKPRIFDDGNGTFWENCTNLFSDPAAWHEALHKYRQENFGTLPDPKGWPEKSEHPQEVQKVSKLLDRMRRDGFFAELDKHIDVLEGELQCLVYGAENGSLINNLERSMNTKELSAKDVPFYAQQSAPHNGQPSLEESLPAALSELDTLISNPFRKTFTDDGSRQDIAKVQSKASRAPAEIFSDLLSQKQIDDLHRMSASAQEAAEVLVGAIRDEASVALDELKRVFHDAADANPHTAEEMRDFTSALDKLISKAVADPNLESDLSKLVDRLGRAMGSSDVDQPSESNARSREISHIGQGFKEVKEVVQQTLPDGSVKRKEAIRIYDSNGNVVLDSDVDDAAYFQFHRGLIISTRPYMSYIRQEAESHRDNHRDEDRASRELAEYEETLRWLEEHQGRNPEPTKEPESLGSDEKGEIRQGKKKGWFWK